MVLERKMPFATLEGAIQDESVEFYVEESSIARHMLHVNIISPEPRKTSG